MQRQSVRASPTQRRSRATVALVAIAALVTWVVAAVLFAFVIPTMLADTWPLAAPESAAAVTRIAAITSAVIGVGVVAGTLAILSRHANTAGRLVLVASGVAAIVVGPLHATGGVAFLQHGPAMRPTAVAMLIVSAALVAVGLLACAAGLSNLLPGRSLAERAILEHPRPLSSQARRRMGALTGVAVIAWATVLGLLLATVRPGIESTAFPVVVFAAAVLVPPALAGGIIGGWREGAPNRLATLGLAAAGGVAANWLFLFVLWLWDLAMYPGQDLASGSLDIDVPVAFAIVGSFLGAAGFGLERVSMHRARQSKESNMSQTQASGPGRREDSGGRLVAAIAAVLWTAVLPFAFWLERNPDAPNEVAIAEFVLALVIVPLTIGASVGLLWHRHPVLIGALMALVAAWAWLVIGVIVTLITRFEFEMTYLRSEWPEAILVLVVFGLAGGLMGAAGAAVTRRVHRRHARSIA